jgi:hypothetical protein
MSITSIITIILKNKNYHSRGALPLGVSDFVCGENKLINLAITAMSFGTYLTYTAIQNLNILVSIGNIAQKVIQSCKTWDVDLPHEM